MPTGRGSDADHLLPLGLPRSATAYTAGGGLWSWNGLWCCMLPTILVVIAASILTGLWVITVLLLGLCALYFLWLIPTAIWFRGSFQLWALQRPDNLLVRLLFPAIELIDGLRTGDAQAALHRFEQWGNNFCAAGEVWLCSYKDVAAALSSPQGRTYNLGEHSLIPSHLPDESSGRCVFLLALSDKAATGTGDHEAFRQCMIDYIFTAEAQARETDATSLKLMDELAKDYKEMDSDTFYNSTDKGNQGFWIKYLHHVLFNLPVNDPALVAKLKFAASQLVYYMMPMGYVFSHDSISETILSVYETSPALQNFKEGEPKYNLMTRHELCALMVSIMRIAGVNGSQFFLFVATAGVQHGYIPIDTREYWDSLNLDDAGAVRKYALECARLSAPVTVTHRVSTEAFTCKIQNKDYTFPRGTKIGIPICLANVDKEFWGADAYQFNPSRPNLESHFLGFHSVGGHHVGRECPAKEMVMRTMVRALQTVGRTRPRKLAPGPQTPLRKSPAMPPFGCC